jgi:flagellar biosynthesis protein FlhB
VSDDGQEKTHDASERKLEKAAEEGQMVKSQELNSLVVLACGAAGLTLLSGPTGDALGELLVWCYSSGTHMDLDAAHQMLSMAARATAIAVALPLGLIVLGVLFIGFAQTRFKLATKALDPKPERLDPIKGFKNRFMSSQPAMELVKGVAKIVALSAVFWNAIEGKIDEMPAIVTLHPRQQLWLLVDTAWDVVMWSLPLVAVVAAADYGYSYWKHQEDNKMSTQELKDERKDSDGDPHVKQARRQRALQIAMGNALRDVHEADMVVTNPTHYAVAIKYDKSKAPAPIIVAMGVDHMALKIREEARKHDIPRIENRPLARALHARGKVGKVIPEELFGPVAKVLAIVYRRRRSRVS